MWTFFWKVLSRFWPESAAAKKRTRLERLEDRIESQDRQIKKLFATGGRCCEHCPGHKE